MNGIFLSKALRTIANIVFFLIIFLIIAACSSYNKSNSKSVGGQSGYETYDQVYESDPSVSGFNLSGSLTVSSGATCDWDVNDPDAPYQANDDPEDSQTIEAPVVVGGFIGLEEDDTQDLSVDSQDTGDYYAVRLSAGDVVTMLEIDQSESGAIQVELLLGDEPTTRVGSYLLDAGESFSAPETNDYLIHVFADEGSFNYVLSIGEESDQVEQSSASEDEYVEGEAIVRFENSNVSAQSGNDIKSFAVQNDMLASNTETDQPVLLQFNTAEQKKSLRSYLNISTQGFKKSADSKDSTSSDDTSDETLAIIAALNQRSDIRYAEPNYIRKLYYEPNDEYYFYQWHYPLINLEEAWDITMGSSDVVVAVVDSGVRFDHPDLTDKLNDDGYDFVSDTDMSLDDDGLDSDPTDPGDEPDGGSSFHGTHVSGTIAAATDNSVGVAGVGGDTRILPVRSFGIHGTGDVADTLEAIKYAAGITNTSGLLPSQTADVINLSIGGASYSQAEAEVFDEIINNRNIIVVAAAGNEGSNTPSYPASYDGVISVSAVDYDQQLTTYSNYGDYIDLAAPGGNLSVDSNQDDWVDGVLSTIAVDQSSFRLDYGFYEGTSMATPHVSGVIALMKAVRPALTSAEVLGWMAQGALSTDLGTTGWDEQFGYGLIDAQKAVIAARDGQTPSISLSASPSQVSFGASQSEATLKLSKISQDDVTFSRINNTSDWVEVEAVSVDDQGVGTYQISIDRSHEDLAEAGNYTAQVQFIFEEQTVTVSLSVQTGDSSSLFDDNYIGHLHVLLIDGNGATTYGTAADYDGNGVYTFEFDNLPSGTYRVVAGSNRDYDGYVGEAGEALSEDVQKVKLTEDTQLAQPLAIDFNVE